MNFNQQLEVALQAAQAASVEIMKIYQTNEFDTKMKEDDSPVTKADLLADEIITRILKEAYPDYGLLSEESSDDKTRLDKQFVWIIDPIDGTKDFIHHTDEFTINIALIQNHKVVVGVIAIPAKNEVYYASMNQGAYHIADNITKKISIDAKNDQLIMLRSRFHFGGKEEKYFNEHKRLSKLLEVGSSIKACYIASGKAHVYPKLGPGTKEWDVAPSAIIVQEAGGYFLKPNGEEMLFNRADVNNLDGFIILHQFDSEFLVK